MEGLDIPKDWQRSAAAIIQNRWRKVLVLGASDRGKSTYCGFLAERLCGAGFKVAFVDADIGQKDIGPPATITLGYCEERTPLAEIQPAAFYFVGAVTPVGHFLPMVVGTRRLLDLAKAPFAIIDTTGLIQGSGQALKSFQIDSLQPDIIIALGHKSELREIIKSHRHFNIQRLRPSEKARAKPSQVRRMKREQAFRRYFQKAREAVLDLDRLVLQRSPLFNGKAIEDPRFVYGERVGDRVVAVAQEALATPLEGFHVLKAGFEKNLLCGVADRFGEGLGIGIIKSIDFERLQVLLLTPVSVKRIKVLQFGDLYVSPDGQEQGKAKNFW